LDFGSKGLGWLQLDLIAAPPGYKKNHPIWPVKDSGVFLPVQQPAMPYAIRWAWRAVAVSSDETVFFSIA
jgi:hypothetical protein